MLAAATVKISSSFHQYTGLRLAPESLSRRGTSSIRTYIAVAICMSSAVLGAIAIRKGWESVSSVASNVALPWFLAGSWLAGDFSREGLKRLNKSMARDLPGSEAGETTEDPAARSCDE
jgi:hypothetical protein